MAFAYHVLGGLMVYGVLFYRILIQMASMVLLLAWWDDGSGLPLAWRVDGLWRHFHGLWTLAERHAFKRSRNCVIDLLLAWWNDGFRLPRAWRIAGLWRLALQDLHSDGFHGPTACMVG